MLTYINVLNVDVNHSSKKTFSKENEKAVFTIAFFIDILFIKPSHRKNNIGVKRGNTTFFFLSPFYLPPTSKVFFLSLVK